MTSPLPQPKVQPEPKKERVKWSGYARSVECSLQHGTYNNFRIIRLKIEDGVVVERVESEQYCSIEAIAKLEGEVNSATLGLNFNYKDGKTWDR